jgi:predicted transcriptional regulator
MNREEKSEKFRQDALAAWTNYQATALYVTASEADKWLAKLQAGSLRPSAELLYSHQKKA